MNKLVFSLIFFFSFSILYSEKLQIRFDRLSVEDGLSQSVVNCFYQDDKGFMWIGTNDGLNKYDGYNFNIFKNDPVSINSISSNTIKSIYQDKNKVLWIGTSNGLNLFGGNWKGFKRLIFNSFKFKNSINNITSIIQFDKNRLLIGTWGAGLLITDLNGKVLNHHFNDKENELSLSNDKITKIYKDSKKNIWVLTVSGLNRLIDNKGIYKRYFANKRITLNNIEYNSVRGILELSDGKIVVGIYENGVYQYILKEDIFVKFSICSSNKSIFEKVMGIIEDETGNIWFATDGNGLLRFEKNTKKCFQYTNSENNLNSLSFNEILTMYKDIEGTIWLGTDQGSISKFNLKEIKFKKINQINKIKGVWAIYKNDDALWIGTDSNGLVRVNQLTGNFKFYKNGGINSISYNQVLSISKADNRGLWVGTDGEGLNRYFSEKDNFFVYKKIPDDPFSISDNYIITSIQDKDTVWIGSYAGGLSGFNIKTQKFKNYLHKNNDKGSIAGNYVIAIEKNDSETLWVGTYGFGLDLFNKKTGTFKHFKYSLENKNSISSNTILSLYVDKKSLLWIGTLGGGLNRLNKSGDFNYYLEKDGLCNNTVTGIVEDNKGYLWLSTKGGISKFDPDTKIFRNYDKRDGIQSREFNFGSSFKDKEGLIYFGGVNGLNYFNPENVVDNVFVPQCEITKIKKGDVDVSVNKINKDGLKIKHNEFPIYIEFSLLSFISPKKNKYAYKIKELDNKWHYSDSKSRFVVYNTLEHGNYTFCYKGTNNDGIWQKKVNVLKLYIIPQFWQTLPFRIFFIIVFSLMSYIIISFIRRHIKLIDFWKTKKYISRFLLLDKIGSGGMGTIYKANNISNNNEIVAIKVLNNELFDDENSRKRFKQEAIIIDQLDHPNIIKIIERGLSGDNLYMVMELLEGRTLSEEIENNKLIELPKILHIIKQILDAIEKVHSRNIIHRDIKPENVMLIKKNGDDDFVKLLDFGLATMAYQTRLTQTGIIIGTINYMAPEQITNSITSKSTDIYSLGVLFYQIVTGRKPFAGETAVSLMKQIIDVDAIEPVKFRQNIPQEFNQLILNMINKESVNRPELSEIIQVINSI